MSNDMPQTARGAHLRTVALPRDANTSGDIFGGWTLSQMDLAGGTFAAAHVGKRVVTVRIDAVEFIKPVSVGDDVSVFCALEDEGNIAVRVKVWARIRTGNAPHKVTKGVFPLRRRKQGWKTDVFPLSRQLGQWRHGPVRVRRSAVHPATPITADGRPT